jgi:hypothetical protein
MKMGYKITFKNIRNAYDVRDIINIEIVLQLILYSKTTYWNNIITQKNNIIKNNTLV